MKKRVLGIVVLALGTLCTTSCLGWQRESDSLVGFDQAAWNKLGERRVRLAAERDVIGVTFVKGRYRRIMLAVHGSAIEMFDVQVTFANGEMFSPEMRLYFAEDSRSRVIDLPGGKRTIKKVAFQYRSKNALTGFAEVELWGKY